MKINTNKLPETTKERFADFIRAEINTLEKDAKMTTEVIQRNEAERQTLSERMVRLNADIKSSMDFVAENRVAVKELSRHIK